MKELTCERCNEPFVPDYRENTQYCGSCFDEARMCYVCGKHVHHEEANCPERIQR